MNTAPRRILLAPLDWGLGHTARCVPIIGSLLSAGHSVTAAGNKAQRYFLQSVFPGLEVLPLEGYGVRYARSRAAFLPRLLTQGPKLLRAVRTEHRWLGALLAQRSFDGLISDNRYGLHHPQIPSVILTHQLSPRTGVGAAFDNAARRLHYRSLARFGAVWAVDVPEAPGLSGVLAHPPKLPPRTRYIGLLSGVDAAAASAEAPAPSSPHLLVLLSGPEPQRTLLSAKLWAQVRVHAGPVHFVEGRHDASRPADVPAHVRWHAQLPPTALRPLIAGASVMVCRSGYSTLMDLAALGARAVLVPTPGQPEQEYLGRHLHEQGLAHCVRQEDFVLEAAVAQAVRLRQTAPLPGAHALYQAVLMEWVSGLVG